MGNGRSRTVAALWGARDGAAALEFALVGPFLVTLFAGVVSFGAGLRAKLEVGNAARAGAAYASAHASRDEAKIRAAAQGATTLANVAVIVIPATASCMNPATGAISGAGPATTCPGTGARPGTYVTVVTQMPYTFIFPPPGLARTTTLGGKAVARVE